MGKQSLRHWDVFISHASEDKNQVARPLAQALEQRGLKVWYDEFSLKLGDSLHRKIEHGLANSRFGVVIISPNFFAKEWPKRELDILVSREVQTRKKRMLPVWHNIDQQTVAKYSPGLADRFAAKTSEGMENVAEKIIQAVRGRRQMGLESSEPADDDLVSVGFKNAFSRRLAELREALGHRKWESDQEEDLIDSILMMVKERIDKWDIPSVRFATRELFLNLYVFSENGILRDLYRVFGDLFARAYSQRHRLLDEMIRVFNHIMLETWLKSEDVSKGESAAEIMVNLGKEFLSKDLKVVQDCLAAIDNLAGDYFAPEILSKEILLTCAAFEIMEPPKRVEKFVEQAVDWIRINDQYAWDARIYTYLRDAIDYAKFEQEKFDLNIAKLKADYLDSILEGNIDSQVENYAEYITGEIVPSEDLSFKIEDLILLINAYESVRPTVAAEIGERISNKGKSRGEEIFKRIISESNFLKAVYGNGQMITTLDELIRFIESSADLDNQRIGFTTFGFSWIEFVRNIRDDEKASIKELLKKYRIKGDPELENDRLSFMMDDLVYVGEGQHEMRQLISFLREINKIVEIRGFSTDFDFRLRRLTAP